MKTTKLLQYFKFIFLSFYKINGSFECSYWKYITTTWPLYLFRVSVNLVTTFQCTQVLKGFGGRNRLYSIEGGIAGGNVEMLVGGIFGGSEGGGEKEVGGTLERFLRGIEQMGKIKMQWRIKNGRKRSGRNSGGRNSGRNET